MEGPNVAFLRPPPGLKTGVENDIFWSEIGSGSGEPGGTPPPKNFQEYPPVRGGGLELRHREHNNDP